MIAIEGLQECVDSTLKILRNEQVYGQTFRLELMRLSRDLAKSTFSFTNTGRDMVVVPILRAGLGMLDGVLGVLPEADVGFIGIKRYEHFNGGIQHIVYYKALPDVENKDVVILDPMLATGGSAVQACEIVKSAGARRVIILCAIAAPEGLNAVTASTLYDVEVIPAVVDEGLDDNAMIVPGLGDAGDRLYGEVK